MCKTPAPIYMLSKCNTNIAPMLATAIAQAVWYHTLLVHAKRGAKDIRWNHVGHTWISIRQICCFSIFMPVFTSGGDCSSWDAASIT